MSDTGANRYGPETITVELPAMDFTEEVARLERMGRAMELVGELTPGEFAQWMEQGEHIRARKAQGKGEAPYAADAGEHIA